MDEYLIAQPSLPITLVHFFLFCNVFRVRRRFELVWAGVFVLNAFAWSLAGRFNWWFILASQTPVTVSVIAKEICSDRYHGVLCRRQDSQRS